MMSLSADSEALEEALLREGVHLDGGEACLRVNTAATCLLGLHELMPSLLRLTLDGSCVVSVRDLGTRLPHLLMLSLNDCGLSELEGVAAFPQLRELSACSNRIADTSGLAMHAHLTVLRMSANRVCSLSVTDALSTCPKLAHLSLDLNPIHSAPNYTLVVAALLPQLISLDGHEVDRSNKVSHAMVLDTAAALSIIEDEMAEELRMERVIFQPDDVLPVGSDADSELTYGASESLAGSAASAVRRRRARMREVGEMSIGGSSESVLHLLDRALSSNGKGKDEVRHESLLTHVPQEGPRRPVSASVRPSSSASLESPRQINASRPQSQSNRRTYSTFLCEPLRIVHIDEERQRVMPMARSRDSRDGDGSGSEEDEDRQGGENLGRALGFDLTGSLAAIEEWARELGDSDDSGDTPDDTPNATPRARTRAVPKTGRCEAPGSVLSRADILSMCKGETEEGVPDGGETEASVGVFDAHFDCAAGEEEEVEEGGCAQEYLRRNGLDYHGGLRSAELRASVQMELLEVSPTRSIGKGRGRGRGMALAQQDQGEACFMTDEALTELLRRPPKLVSQLRTKSSFQMFFRGMPIERMRALLEDAYADGDDCRAKADKRMQLMHGLLVDR